MAVESNKRIKSVYNWALLAIVLVGIILVNVINSFVYKRIDMTDDQRYSLNESTIEFLEKNDSTMQGRVYIEIFFDGSMPAELEHFRRSIEDKLKEFKEIAGDRIEYKFTDPKVGTEKEIQEREQILWDEGRGILPLNVKYKQDGHESQLRLWPGAIIEYGGASAPKRLPIQLLPGTESLRPVQLEELPTVIENATRNLEYVLMSGLRRIITDKKPRIGFLQGQDELNLGATYLARSIISPFYSVADVSLNDSIHALDGFDGLVIARPMARFSERDLYLIDQFVMRGGRLMCFIDGLEMREDSLRKYHQTHTTRINTGLNELLFDYGISIQDNYVLDARCAVKPISTEQNATLPWFYHVLATPTSHPISRNVEPVSLKYTNQLMLRQNMKGVVVSPVLKSSTNSTTTGLTPLVSYAIPLNYLQEGKTPQLAVNPKSTANERCLAAVAEGHFTSSFKNRLPPEFTNAKEIGYLSESSKEGKVFVVGNGRMIENRYDTTRNELGQLQYRSPKIQLNDLQFDLELAQAKYPHMFGNQEFFQNTCDFMMGDHSVLDIRSRQIEIHELDKVKVQEEGTFYKIINVALPILLILALAGIMYFIRYRKYTS